jgi:hypothetical protein
MSTEQQKPRFAILVVTLAAFLFVLAPLSRERIGGQTVAPPILTFVLGVGVYACAQTRRSFFIALALALPAAVLLWRSDGEGAERGTAAWLLLALFIVYLLTVVGAAVIRARRVTLDTILGAIAVYLLLAMVWTLLYAVVALLDPNAFQLPSVDAARIDRARLGADLPTFVYYSFVTLTTMGYGDVLPLSHAARGLATCEAVVGQIYLAVLVARLVGLHIIHAERHDD